MKTYLQNKNFTTDTIKIYIRYNNLFLSYLSSQNLLISEAKYTDILSFIEELKSTGRTANNINVVLTSIRHYYRYLQITSDIKNIAEGIILKGIRQKIPVNLLNTKELTELFENYQITDNRTQRNKVILSLFIYQAITTGELHKLKPENIKLEKVRIYIPGSKRINSRTLDLSPKQIIILHNYITKIRPKLNQKNSEQLFVSMESKNELKNSLFHLFRALKKLNPAVENAKQIRMSVIRNKLKNNNLRQVQYFAGHKYVSSTERYKLGNIETLKKDVEKYHPLKKIEN